MHNHSNRALAEVNWPAKIKLRQTVLYLNLKRKTPLQQPTLTSYGQYHENLFMPYTNNKGADQPAHLRILNSTFVVRHLDSIIPLVSISEILSLYLASVAAQAGLCLIWSETPKTGFLVTRLKLQQSELETTLFVSFV